MNAPRPPPGAAPVVLVVGGTVTRDRVADLCAHVRGLLEEHGARALVCEVGPVESPGLACVEALARMQLVARRLGAAVRVRGAAEVHELLELCGVAGAIPTEEEER